MARIALLFSSLLVLLGAAAPRPVVTDDEITYRVKVGLVDSVWVTGSLIAVDTRQGQVTLFGPVPSRPSADRAVILAKDVRGVTKVRNELQVVPKSRQATFATSDAQIRAALKKSLSDESRFKALGFRVADGAVLLTGRADAAAKADAVRIVKATPGVRKVIENLEPAPNSRPSA